MKKDKLVIAGREFNSRLMLGTGKYKDFSVMNRAFAASDAEIVTVAVRRVDLKAKGHEKLMEHLDTKKYFLLPNTAGCQTADEAIRIARMGRAMGFSNWVKLEVIPDPKYLLPDPFGTMEAAKKLVEEGFVVLPYINADPILAKKLEELGCATVMPLAAPIGTGRGLLTAANIQVIIEQSNIPVVIDAGLGVPSDASRAMEIGAAAVLVNTAVAEAQDPVMMADAFKSGVEAGRKGYLAGRIPEKPYASASSPLQGIVGKS